MVATERVFELSGSTLAGVGAVLGALAGAISFLFRKLIESKDAQIDECHRDRDYWRDFALSLLDPADKALTVAEHEMRRPRSNQ